MSFKKPSTCINKSFQKAIEILLFGQIFDQEKDPQSALAAYQNALKQFVPSFQATDFYANPSLDQYVRSPRNLMRSLAAKATTLHQFHKDDLNKSESIAATVATYDLAIQVAE